MSKNKNSDTRNITKQGESGYRVRLKIEGHTIDQSFDNLADAQIFRDLEKAKSALDDSERQIYVARAIKKSNRGYSFALAIKDYRPYSEKKKGADQEKSMLNLLERLPIAKRPLQMIGEEDLKAMFEDIKSGKYRKNGNRKFKVTTDSTAKRYLNLISHVFTVAVNKNKISINPMSLLPSYERPKDGKSRDRRFEGDEEKELRKILDQEMIAILTVLIETTAREGELLSMEWNRIEFYIDNDKVERGIAKTLETKNGEINNLPLSSVAVTAFRSMIKKGTEKPVTGKVFSYSKTQVTDRWNNARTIIKATDLRIHDMRHEGISRLFEEKEMNVIEAAAISNHKDLRMLKRYANLSPKKLAKKLG
jgi:integrase